MIIGSVGRYSPEIGWIRGKLWKSFVRCPKTGFHLILIVRRLMVDTFPTIVCLFVGGLFRRLSRKS